MTPTDSVFLLAESREHPMHVGGLQLFEPPDGAGPEFVREFYDAGRPAGLPADLPQASGESSAGSPTWRWSYDKDIDIDYHVRRSALPSPGRVRELLELTSGCTAACSTGTVRCGRRIWWRVSTTAGSRCTPSFTTR